jgi:hypothetical protein
MDNKRRPSGFGPDQIPAGMQAARFYGQDVLIPAAGEEPPVQDMPYTARQLDALRALARKRQDALAREPLPVTAEIYTVA